MLFAFTSTRINFSFYAFLSNYFMIPLGIVPLIWILTGRLQPQRDVRSPQEPGSSSVLQLLRSKRFLLGLLIVVLTTLSDGYFAFFILLLLCFAIFIRAVLGDVLRPARLWGPAIYVVVLLGTSLALQIPLNDYRRSHPEEFAPGGVEDQDLKRKAFEAEVYASSLKILVAPISNHRIAPLGELGARILGTVNDARRIPILRPTVQLGSLATFLFFGALILAAAWMVRIGDVSTSSSHRNFRLSECRAQLMTVVTLSFFVFLCSTSGGIGTLIALVFPTIRAYDRFPLFLIFLLYLGAGMLITSVLRSASPIKRMACSFLVVMATVLALFDQVPGNVAGHTPQARARFMAERAFVQNIAAALPPEAMVYQYPYSQYFTRSPYYGWGSFSHIRLAIHSDRLRWSNGASKNSPIDVYHTRTARLPLQNMLAEIEALGFRGIVVDRGFLSGPEYEAISSALTSRTGVTPTDDEQGRLAFWALPDRGYRLEYDRAYIEPERLVVKDPQKIDPARLPRVINADVLIALLRHNDGLGPITLERAVYPDLFVDSRTRLREAGDLAVVPHGDLKGDVLCSSGNAPMGVNGVVTLTVRNQTDFDWRFGQGRFPFGIGVHIEKADGSMLLFDPGYRVPTQAVVPRGGEIDLQVAVSSLSLPASAASEPEFTLVFDLLQGNNAWFSSVGPNDVCRVPIRQLG
jgi:hypothetical protein